jgi:hypothetical protein
MTGREVLLTSIVWEVLDMIQALSCMIHVEGLAEDRLDQIHENCKKLQESLGGWK